jgi:cellulose synthase/poly-beta-1,6-N-acetylglucosamine synthase-like glycosyltransferase
MISIIITSYKEPQTITKAIESVAEQHIPDSEVLVVAPDMETLREASKLRAKYKNLRLIQDEGKGKPVALNLAVSKSKGEILVLTDGDVFVGRNSIKLLLDKFKDLKTGAVSGNPVSLNPKNTMYGFWADILTQTANERRKKALLIKKRFFCSGYLFAIRKDLFPKLPENLLSEDGYISHKVYQSGYKILYSPESKVYVKYPNNFSDWIKQKKRSAGGYNQIKKMIGVEIRSFKKESFGALNLFKYISNFKEFFWLFGLFLARVYLWLAIYKDINLSKKTQKQLWQRIESTK